MLSRNELNLRTGHVVNGAMEVHSWLGPRCLESAYQACLAYELRSRGLNVREQVLLPVQYKGVRVARGYRLDLLVDNEVIVELKSIAALRPVHEAQLLSYLIMSNRRVGLLINFNELHLKDGIRRIVNNY